MQVEAEAGFVLVRGCRGGGGRCGIMVWGEVWDGGRGLSHVASGIMWFSMVVRNVWYVSMYGHPWDEVVCGVMCVEVELKYRVVRGGELGCVSECGWGGFQHQQVCSCWQGWR